MRRLSGLLLALCLGSGVAEALSLGDGVVVLFKDGSKLSGVLVDETRTRISIDVGGGAEVTSDRADVQSVVAKKTAVQRFQEMLRAAGSDPRKLRGAASFARAHNLYTGYDQLAKRLGLSPQDSPPAAEEMPPVPVEPEPAPTASAAPPLLALETPDPPAQPLSGFPVDNFVSPVPDNGVDCNQPYLFSWVDPNASQKRAAQVNYQAIPLKQEVASREAPKREIAEPPGKQLNVPQAQDRDARGVPFVSAQR